MKQNYQELKFRINSLNQLLESYHTDIKTFPIQKIFSESKYISFSVRLPGKTIYIYTGRGNNFEGILVGSKNIPSEFRIRDRYLEYLRKYLCGARIKTIILDEDDRIIMFPYYKSKNECFFALFYLGRNLYFMNIFKNTKGDYELFLSWELSRKNIIDVGSFEDMKNTCIKYFNILGRKAVARPVLEEIEFVSDEEKLMEHYSKLSSKQTYAPSSKRKRKFYLKKEIRILEDLNRVKLYKDIKNLIESEGYQLPTELKFELFGIKFKIDPSWNHHKRVNEIYLKIKKLKKAQSILEKRLEDTKNDCRNWQEGKDNKKILSEKISVPIWYNSNNDKKSIDVESNKKYNYKTFETHKGILFWVGQDVEANDFLRSKMAHKDDMWFHIDGMKSAHLIAKIKSFSDISSEDFILFGSVLKEFTHTNLSQIQLIYTQVKNLKGVKGKKGSVTVKKQKYLVIDYDKNWREKVN